MWADQVNPLQDPQRHFAHTNPAPGRVGSTRPSLHRGTTIATSPVRALTNTYAPPRRYPGGTCALPLCSAPLLRPLPTRLWAGGEALGPPLVTAPPPRSFTAPPPPSVMAPPSSPVTAPSLLLLLFETSMTSGGVWLVVAALPRCDGRRGACRCPTAAALPLRSGRGTGSSPGTPSPDDGTGTRRTPAGPRPPLLPLP